MSGDDLADLLRVLVEQQRAEDAAARAAWLLAEAEEADPARPAEVARARERYEAAVAAVEAARARRREIEAQIDPREVDRARAMLAGGARG
jgi:ATPase subunit of ABC transporter with duplicated ATPase domains